MIALRASLCSAILLAALLPASFAARPVLAADCGYDGYFDANTEVHSGTEVWDGNLSITAEYIPAKSKLKFTVVASFSEGTGCPSSFTSASGNIGPYAFSMNSTTLTVGSSSFPVTNSSGVWTGAGSLTGVTGFSCSTWTTQGQASGTSGFYSSMTGCVGQSISCNGPATYFSCDCE